MLQVFVIIAPLFLIILVAAVLQRVKRVGENWSEALNNYALYIGLPTLIFVALATTNFSFAEQARTIVANSIFVVGGLVLMFVFGRLLRFREKNFRTIFICFVFGNVAYLGIPVLGQIFGEGVLPTASVIVAVYLFWLFTIGVGFLEYSKEREGGAALKKALLKLVGNPLLIAVVAGVIVASLRIELPEVLMEALRMIAVSVTPIVLVVIGLFIGKTKFGKLIGWVPILLFSVITLFVLPIGFVLVLQLFGFEPGMFAASIVMAAMPLAITPFVLADEYGLDKNFIARTVVASTILSVVSIPLWTSML